MKGEICKRHVRGGDTAVRFAQQIGHDHVGLAQRAPPWGILAREVDALLKLAQGGTRQISSENKPIRFDQFHNSTQRIAQRICALLDPTQQPIILGDQHPIEIG